MRRVALRMEDPQVIMQNLCLGVSSTMENGYEKVTGSIIKQALIDMKNLMAGNREGLSSAEAQEVVDIYGFIHEGDDETPGCLAWYLQSDYLTEQTRYLFDKSVFGGKVLSFRLYCEMQGKEEKYHTIVVVQKEEEEEEEE